MITDTCRYAWNSTKKSHQPEYDNLIQSYRDMLTARAEAVIATKMADDGPFAAFENAVLNAPPEPSASSDQGYEQVVDSESVELVPETEANAAEYEAVGEPFDLDKEEAARLERKRRRDEAQPPPKKKPIRKVVAAVKKAAKKSMPKVKKGKK